jgi:hypothetical protein
MAFTPPIIAVEAPTAIDTYAMIFILKVFYFFFNSSDMWDRLSMISSSICSAVLLLGLACDVAQTKFLEA